MLVCRTIDPNTPGFCTDLSPNISPPRHPAKALYLYLYQPLEQLRVLLCPNRSIMTNERDSSTAIDSKSNFVYLPNISAACRTVHW